VAYYSFSPNVLVWNQLADSQCAVSDEDLKIFGDGLATKFLSTEDLGNTFGNLLGLLAMIFSNLQQGRAEESTSKHHWLQCNCKIK
jgi:hypothetical protein